jgi:hypothetical protein
VEGHGGGAVGRDLGQEVGGDRAVVLREKVEIGVGEVVAALAQLLDEVLGEADLEGRRVGADLVGVPAERSRGDVFGWRRSLIGGSDGIGQLRRVVTDAAVL